MRYPVVASVVVDKTAYRFDKPFDYLVPKELIELCKVGCRVTVPFGRGNSGRQGLVLSLREEEPLNISGLKNIFSVADKKPLLTEEMLYIVLWLKQNTFCTYFDAVKTLLPFGMNLKIVPLLSLKENAKTQAVNSFSAEANSVLDYLKKKGR